MALSSPGIGSGLDVNSMVSQLMALERRPLTALDQREAGLQAKLSAFGTVKGALSSLRSAAQALKDPDKFVARKANITDAAVLSASAKNAARVGSYAIEVQNLAQSQKLAATAVPTAATVVGTGTLRLELGTYSAGTFTPNSQQSAAILTIDSTKNTLAGVCNAINNANAGVTASIVNDGSANRLVLSANSTGLSNALKITVIDDDGNNIDTAGLSQLAFNASTGGTQNLAETVPARNATLRIDGVPITNVSNVISDAIEGVTLTLAKDNLGSTTKLSITHDTSGAKSAIEQFVKAYNDVQTSVKNLSAFNANSRQGAVLNGDSTVRTIQAQLRSTLNTAVSGAAPGMSRLSDAGISFEKDGTLMIDSTKLQSALDDPAGSASSLFAANSVGPGCAAKIDSIVGAMLGSDGLVADRTDGISRSIKDVDNRREALNRRLDLIETRYRSQFTALDTMISSMTKTSTFLQQQLANLPKISN